jgi:hypothetical protein
VLCCVVLLMVKVLIPIVVRVKPLFVCVGIAAILQAEDSVLADHLIVGVSHVKVPIATEVRETIVDHFKMGFQSVRRKTT